MELLITIRLSGVKPCQIAAKRLPDVYRLNREARFAWIAPFGVHTNSFTYTTAFFPRISNFTYAGN